jgi:hypothetical protein
MAGAEPSFSKVHLVRTLLLIWKHPTGRKSLAKILGVGEGSGRTILKRLTRLGMIKSSKLGHEPTSRGRKKVEFYLERFSMPREFHSQEEIFPAETAKSILTVYNSSDKIGTGIEQRDIALSSGAMGAIILPFKNELRFPTRDINLNNFPETRLELEKLDLKDNDLVIIAFANTYAKAENGAVAVALELIK